MGAPSLRITTTGGPLDQLPTGRQDEGSPDLRRREVTRPRGPIARGLNVIDLKDSV